MLMLQVFKKQMISSHALNQPGWMATSLHVPGTTSPMKGHAPTIIWKGGITV